MNQFNLKQSSESTMMSNGSLRRTPLIVTLLLAFSTSFLLYLLTLAPTVTFEDSGELIAAAYTLGVPHQPGYPLFTIMGRVFTLLPFGNIAYRVNLMSAFLSALGAMFLAGAVILLIDDLERMRRGRSSGRAGRKGKKKLSAAAKAASEKHTGLLKYAAGLAAAIFAAAAFETWEQSIITEVYGLNTMFVGLVLLLAVAWRRESGTERMRCFILLSYILGLMLSNHTTSLMFIPVLLVFALIEDRKFVLNVKHLSVGILFLAVGLLPYLYLPLASARDPLMDWGNPENWTNLIRTVTRHQYGVDIDQTFSGYLAQLSAYAEMLTQQWMPLFLLLVIPGLLALHRQRRSYFYLMLVFWLFAAPATTYLTDFDVNIRDPFAAGEHKALVSVFYIPSYICLAVLMGIGLHAAVTSLSRKLLATRNAVLSGAAIMVALPLAFAYHNYQKLDMSNYYFTEDYAENLFRVVPQKGVVFANWDPFYFPLNYYQFVEQRRRDMVAVDQQLLRRSWYVQWLSAHYPEFTDPAAAEIEAFLDAVRPFENKQPFDPNFIETKYLAMINALIDRAIENGRAVFLTYKPQPGLAEKYGKEPVVVAYHLKSPGDPLTDINLDQFAFRHFFAEGVPKDRMAGYFKEYYGFMLLERGQLLERAGAPQQAVACYVSARDFFADKPSLSVQINERISRLSQSAPQR